MSKREIKAVVPIQNNIQCRVCLQTIREEAISNFCKCQNDFRHAHEKCLLQFAKASKVEAEGKQQFITCEICSARIYLQSQIRVHFSNLNILCRSLWCSGSHLQKLESKIAVILLFLFLVAEVAAIIELYWSVEQSLELEAITGFTIVNSVFLFVTGIYILLKEILVIKRQAIGVRGDKTKIIEMVKEQAQQSLDTYL